VLLSDSSPKALIVVYLPEEGEPKVRPFSESRISNLNLEGLWEFLFSLGQVQAQT
jgi:hypothetical protein